MLRLLTTIVATLALCALSFVTTDAYARGGGHGGGGGFRGGGGFHGGGGFRGGGGAAFRGGGVHVGAFRSGAAVHVGGFRGGAVRFGGIHVAPIRRFIGPAPIVVGYPYLYGDPYLDYPPEQQCIVQRQLVQTVYGVRWRPVTVCYE